MSTVRSERAGLKLGEVILSGGLRLASRLGAPSSAEANADIVAAGQPRAELAVLWSIAGSAELFVDIDCCQWGLRLFDPAAARRATDRFRSERGTDVRSGDVVVGEFLGDLDQLVIGGEGRVLNALPLDSRKEWHMAGETLSAFLHRFRSTSGDKYWAAEG